MNKRDSVTDEEAKIMSDYMFTMDETLTAIGQEILGYTHMFYTGKTKKSPEFSSVQKIAKIMLEYSKKKMEFDKYFEDMKKRYEKEVEL